MRMAVGVGAALFVAGLLAAGTALACYRRNPLLRIECARPGAVLWVDGEPVGPLPAEVTVPGQGCRLRVTHGDFPAWSLEITAAEARRQRRLQVELGERQVGRCTLELTSSPASAEASLDELYRGRTPLRVGDLPSGTHRVVLHLPGHLPAEQDVVLVEGVPGALHTVLHSQIAEFYRTMVERQPDEMNHRADLAHQLVLEQRWDEAIDAFAAGAERLKQDPASEAQRFWQETQSTLSRQYDVGAGAVAARLSDRLLERLAAVCGAEICATPEVCAAYIRLLRAVGRTDEAQRQEALARKKFRGLPGLSRRFAI
jgi:hypothetical protein